MTKDNWIKAYSKIMLEWIESQWKIESAHQAGEPYTRMKFEAEASKVEDKLKNLISQVEKDAIEKTNKRWREKLNAIADGAVGLTKDTSGNDREYLWYDDVQKVISDLLEDKRPYFPDIPPVIIKKAVRVK